jgi:menaquinone-dependent protoporphyrinogen oxidase
MTRILVIYGTTDGHTRKVASRLGTMFREHAAGVDVVEAGALEVSPLYYNAVVICASVHGGHYQRAVTTWVRAHAHALNGTRTAFVSVCLGVLQKDPKVDQELDGIAERFFADTQWQPTRVKKIAGALLYRQYGWLKRRLMKRIVAKAGGDTDMTKDYEYTDWEELQVFVDGFMLTVTPARKPLAAVSA